MNYNFIGRDTQLFLKKGEYIKQLTKIRFQLMLVCSKCYNEHHDQGMGKERMFDYWYKYFKK